MRAALAPPGDGADAAGGAGAGDRPLCATLAYRSGLSEIDDRDGEELAALRDAQRRAGGPAVAASELAQHRLAEAKSLVRSGRAALLARTCPRSHELKQFSLSSSISRYRGKNNSRGTFMDRLDRKILR